MRWRRIQFLAKQENAGLLFLRLFPAIRRVLVMKTAECAVLGHPGKPGGVVDVTFVGRSLLDCLRHTVKLKWEMGMSGIREGCNHETQVEWPAWGPIHCSFLLLVRFFCFR